MARLLQKYKKDVMLLMMKKFSYKGPMQVPKIEKVVVNVGMGKATQDIKLLDVASKEIADITGQRPVVTKAKKSIASFKLREGMPIGCTTTLRGYRMYEFLDRLMNVALPRIRDFKGVSGKIFDGRGNCTIGIKEQSIFPEIEYDKVASIHGMDIVIVTTARTDEEGRALLSFLGMPFR